MRILYFIVIGLLAVIDSLLISKPNFLGKLGLWIFKYRYLRTFPRTLATVAIVVVSALCLSELITWLGKSKTIKPFKSIILLFVLLLATCGVLAKIVIDFSHGIYSHTGIYFRYGVILLPSTLIFIFVTSLLRFTDKKL